MMTTRIVSGLVWLLLLALTACGPGAPPPEPSTVTVARGDLRVTVLESGETQAAREALLRSEIDGTATIIFLIPEGVTVQQGETLVELDVSELRDRRANRAIALVRAERALAKAENDAQAAALRAECEITAERVAHLDQQIENAVIRAPIPGLVVYMDGGLAVKLEEGSVVRKRQRLIILFDIARIRTVVNVQAKDRPRIEVGQLANVSVDAFAATSFAGKVVAAGDVREAKRVVVELDGTNPDGLLRPGMSAKVEIVLDQLDDVLVVPLQAVRHEGASVWVQKKTADGPRIVPVVLGAHDRRRVEVRGGLAEGDVLYLSPTEEQP